MNASGILDRNLVALSTRQPESVALLTQAVGNPNLEFVESRKGPLVPVIKRNGRPFPMHSRFDPEAEGRRLADGAPEGFLIAFGLGGAYHLLPLLGKTATTGLIIVERDPGIVKRILENIDMRGLLSDTRVILLIDPSPKELTDIVLERYLPVLYGNLGSISLRTRWDSEPTWFSERAEALRGLPESLGRDYTVQSKFGRRWFVHTVANLARSEEVQCSLPPARHLLITAAGPSLQDQLPVIRKLKKEGAVLLATDTSLPVLVAGKIPPDFVLSIDCQVVSYHHFLKGLPKETVLILDLASPPVLTRLTNRILFFASGHPFSLYLNQLYRPFPIIDLSGGNVTHAAASFAQVAGARKVRLFGGDFSYPNGRPYARGTYVFPYFQSRSNRLEGSETSFWRFIASSRPRREILQDRWRWRTSAMDHYRKSLEEAAAATDYDFSAEPGAGVDIRPSSGTHRDSTKNVRDFPSILSAGPVTTNWKEFIADYRNRLISLPPLNGPPQDYLADLDPENRQAWATLLPAAATFREISDDGPAAVEKARKWTLERITNLKRR